MNTGPGAAGLLWLWATVAEPGPSDPPEPPSGPAPPMIAAPGGPAGPRES